MKVSVVGLGWYGTPLAEALALAGFEVRGSKRSIVPFPGISLFPLAPPALPAPELLGTEVLILNIPPFEGQLEWFKEWKFPRRPWVIFISSTSRSPQLLEQEQWIQQNFKEWTVLRFGGLLGGNRHPGKHLAGRKNLKGRLWPVNLLHLTDAVGFTLAVIEQEIKQEVIDVVSDEHRTREEFYTEYAKIAGLPLPEFDESDSSVKEPVSNQRAKKIYQFSWP